RVVVVNRTAAGEISRAAHSTLEHVAVEKLAWCCVALWHRFGFPRAGCVRLSPAWRPSAFLSSGLARCTARSDCGRASCITVGTGIPPVQPRGSGGRGLSPPVWILSSPGTRFYCNAKSARLFPTGRRGRGDEVAQRRIGQVRLGD